MTLRTRSINCWIPVCPKNTDRRRDTEHKSPEIICWRSFSLLHHKNKRSCLRVIIWRKFETYLSKFHNFSTARIENALCVVRGKIVTPHRRFSTVGYAGPPVELFAEVWPRRRQDRGRQVSIVGLACSLLTLGHREYGGECITSELSEMLCVRQVVPSVQLGHRRDGSGVSDIPCCL